MKPFSLSNTLSDYTKGRKNKLADYQSGFAYLTSHRACYVDNKEPRKFCVAIELKDVDRIEPYTGFLKSSPKISLYLRPSQVSAQAPQSSLSTPRSETPFIRPAPPPPVTGVWICTICSFSNPIPSNYIPGVTQATSMPPCGTCGISPQPSHLEASLRKFQSLGGTVGGISSNCAPLVLDSRLACPRCTFHNHPSLFTCELCGESLCNAPASALPPIQHSSPVSTIAEIQIIKFSFRSGGSTTFFTHLKSALIQRKWLLSTAPSIPRPPTPTSSAFPTRRVGIGGLERKTDSVTLANSRVLSTAFEDLASLQSAAKDVIALAESFSRLSGGSSSHVSQALGLVSRDMFSAERAWIDELARQVAEFLADDARGVLKREGGVMTLVDLWAVYNRARGIDLISPRDLEKAAGRFEALRLPVRMRVFRSGLLVVQDASRKDADTVRKILEWVDSVSSDEEKASGFGGGVTPGEAAERFGWSLGVANEELEMAEEQGALCREVSIQGIRFWKNWFIQKHSVAV